MKRKLLSLLLLLFALFSIVIFPDPLQAQVNSEPLKVKVGIYDNHPKIYLDDGVAKGFWPDVLNYIASQENWEIEYVEGTWTQCLERLENNEIDVMPDVAYSKERSEIYTLSSQTVLINWASVYTKPGLEINSFTDLDGKDIAVLEGGIHYIGPLGIKALMDAFDLEANYVEVGVYADSFQAVDDGRADIAVVNRIFGITNEHKYDVKRTNIVFNPIELKFAFAKDGDKTDLLVEKFDYHTKLLKDDESSIYYESILSHLKGVTSEVPVEVTPGWIRPLVITASVLIAVLLLLYLVTKRYQSNLEKKVEDRTKDLMNSEQRYRELTNLLPQMIFEIDTQRKVNYVNKFASTSFGYSLKEFDGLDSLKLFVSKDRKRAEESMKTVLEGGASENHEYTALRKDGTTFPIYVYPAPIKKGDKIIGIRGVVADISEQKETQRKLNEKIKELEKAMKLMVGREVKMTELKAKLKEEKENT